MNTKQVTYLHGYAQFAVEAHQGQKYGDKPYTSHLRQVVDTLVGWKLPPVYVALGWLHDFLEDTDKTIQDLHKFFASYYEGEFEVPDSIVLALPLLTHDPKDTYKEYIDHIIEDEHSYVSELAAVVKLADLQANLSNNPPESLKKRYTAAQAKLKAYLLEIDNPKYDAIFYE